jgi:Tol biopolymer transport system component
MLDSKTLLLSAVKNGHTDIYSLNLQNEKITQITNDVYDDLDPSFVAFPNKTGIIFSSNRPTVQMPNHQTLPCPAITVTIFF